MLLLDWITYHNLPVETVNAEPFQHRLLYGNPLLNSALLPSAKTLLRMLESEYAGAVGPVTEVLQNARSQIHFSLDGWTSKSCTSFLGTNAQFVDYRVGYFTLDNAANNDTCIEDIAFELGFCATERRIRCAAHILNLSVRAMLYGSKGENLVAIVSADGDNDEDEEEVGVAEYSLYGAPGMLHNIVMQLRASPQLYEQFLQSQRMESGKSSTLHWVFNNAIRWDSDKRMMVRALTLRPVLNTFFNDVQNRWERESGSEKTKSVVLEYRLSPYGWKVVEILVKLLKPFEVATKELQSSGMPGTRFTCGSLDEYFPVIKILLDHLENAIEGTVYEEIEDPGTKERKDIETARRAGQQTR
ncbi:hypothetical protein MY8738_008734 [Beauveria namnaoensis]